MKSRIRQITTRSFAHRILAVWAFVAVITSGYTGVAQDSDVSDEPTSSTPINDVDNIYEKKLTDEKKPAALKSAKGGKREKKVVEADGKTSPQYWANRKMRMRFGMEFYSEDNVCNKIYATLPFPRDWPEQKVTIISSEIPEQASHRVRELPAGATQILIDIPTILPQQQLNVVMEVEIEKSFIKPPEHPELLKYPKKRLKEKSMLWYLGDSPYIDTKSKQIRDIAVQIKADEHPHAWGHVEAIYDWVRENIEYRSGPVRSTKDALKDKHGDCEEMTGLFVAICRATNIPARCVWVPDHCYPEFYLEDEEGFGHWFPAQVAGDRQFGQMNEYRPILQKGDKFRIPEKPGDQRYLDEFFTCKIRKPEGADRPRIVSVRDLGELQSELAKLKADTEPKMAQAIGSTPSDSAESAERDTEKDAENDTESDTEKKDKAEQDNVSAAPQPSVKDSSDE